MKKIQKNKMNSAEIKAFIQENRHLFWYTPENKKEDISLDLLVETILNYGTMHDVKKMNDILGIKEVARIFFHAKGRKKMNYYSEIHNYFSLFFKRYA